MKREIYRDTLHVRSTGNILNTVAELEDNREFVYTGKVLNSVIIKKLRNGVQVSTVTLDLEVLEEIVAAAKADAVTEISIEEAFKDQ